MKVGTYQITSCSICLGERPCFALAQQIVILAGLLFSVLTFSYFNFQWPVALPVSILSLCYCIAFLKVCIAQPGIAPDILRRALSQKTDLATTPLIKNTETYKWRVCLDCEAKYELHGQEVLTDKEVWHCVTCDVCVLEMSHHCQFFDRCIGANNKRAFKAVLAGYPLLWLTIGAAICIQLINSE